MVWISTSWVLLVIYGCRTGDYLVIDDGVLHRRQDWLSVWLSASLSPLLFFFLTPYLSGLWFFLLRAFCRCGASSRSVSFSVVLHHSETPICFRLFCPTAWLVAGRRGLLPGLYWWVPLVSSNNSGWASVAGGCSKFWFFSLVVLAVGAWWLSYIGDFPLLVVWSSDVLGFIPCGNPILVGAAFPLRLPDVSQSSSLQSQ